MLALNSSTNFNTGVLPPGTYYFYVQWEGNDGHNEFVRDQSNYIGPITVNGKPYLTFSSPSRMSGPKYSEDEVGDKQLVGLSV